MGCCGNLFLDEDVVKILSTLDLKYEDFKENFEKDVDKIKKSQTEKLENRRKTMQNLANKKKNNQNNQNETKEDIKVTKEDKKKDTKMNKKKETKIDKKKGKAQNKKEETEEDIVKKLNQEELKIEIEILLNEVNKMHYIFDLGLELTEPLRKYTLDKLLKKAKSAPAIALKQIKEKIEEVKSLKVVEFLNSTYGKVLKDALVKKGMSATVLSGFKKKLLEERKKRREEERKEFGIQNEFKDEKVEIEIDLYTFIEKEYDGGKGVVKNFKEYVRGQMVSMIFKA